MRRRERRAAARAQTAASESTENVEDTAADTSEEENVTEKATAAEKVVTAEEVLPAPRKPRACSKCGGPSNGHQGPCEQKCSVILKTPEKERCTIFSGDLSLALTPPQEEREEPNSPGNDGEACEHAGELPVPKEDFYTLEVSCSKEVHSLWCCDVTNPCLHQKLLTVPAPAKVFHPNLQIFGNLSVEGSTSTCSSYIFQKDGQEISTDCFTI